MINSKNNVDYKAEYILDNEYYAYGMIGNFTFLIEIMEASDSIKGDYEYTIATNIHYLLDNELETETSFRELKGTNASIYINPNIKIYQKTSDADGIYFEFPLYKMELINQKLWCGIIRKQSIVFSSLNG